MAGNIEHLLREQKQRLAETQLRLNSPQAPSIHKERRRDADDDGVHREPQVPEQAPGAGKENLRPSVNLEEENSARKRLSDEGALGLEAVPGGPDEFNGGHKMLRYGEYSPNNPQLRVTAAPYLGLGEYEQRRSLFQQKRRAEYLQHLAKVQYDSNQTELNSYVPSSSVMQNSRNLSPYRTQNTSLRPDMDKPKGILTNRRTGSPRERLLSDLKHSYTPSFMDGFSYQDRTEELEREKIKRDTYQRELRLQIEEKRCLQAMREEQERREQELENKRLEQQLLRMQEEQVIEEQRRLRKDEQMRRHSEDLLRRKQELQFRMRKHSDSESSAATSVRNSHYSPPFVRRNPPYSSLSLPTSTRHYNNSSGSGYTGYRREALNRMDSLGNRYGNDYATVGRYDSLSKIDAIGRQEALNRLETLSIQDNSYSRDVYSFGQRRHSATQQDLRRSPKLQRRSNSGRFDDTLPIPVLKAHSPVAKELKNSVPFHSGRSDALRKLEDKWQIPAVQKNILNHGDGQGRNILTQLGAIRMQLQQEQLRMDETLRQRDLTQSKAVDFL